jgi:hypothetical protein
MKPAVNPNGEIELPKRIEIRLDDAYSHQNSRPRYNVTRQAPLSVTQNNPFDLDFEPKVHRPATFRTGSSLRTANSTKVTVQDVMQNSLVTSTNHP